MAINVSSIFTKATFDHECKERNEHHGQVHDAIVAEGTCLFSMSAAEFSTHLSRYQTVSPKFLHSEIIMRTVPMRYTLSVVEFVNSSTIGPLLSIVHSRSPHAYSHSGKARKDDILALNERFGREQHEREQIIARIHAKIKESVVKYDEAEFKRIDQLVKELEDGFEAFKKEIIPQVQSYEGTHLVSFLF